MTELIAGILCGGVIVWLLTRPRGGTQAPNENKIAGLEETAREDHERTQEAKEIYENTKADYLKRFGLYVRKK